MNSELSDEFQNRLSHEVKKAMGMGVVLFGLVSITMLAIPASVYKQTKIIEIMAIFLLLVAASACSSRIAGTRLHLAREAFKSQKYRDCLLLAKPFQEKVMMSSNLRFDRQGEATYMILVSADKTGDSILAARCNKYLLARPGLIFSDKAKAYKLKSDQTD